MVVSNQTKGIKPPEFHIGILPNCLVEKTLELGHAAERLGFEGVWVADSHSVMRDAYAILAILASQTKRLKLASGISHTITRHPAVLANSWSTLHEISGGRSIMGIGVGGSAAQNLGLRPEKLAILEQKVRVIRELMRGKEVEYEGKVIRMAWSDCEVPFIMACSGPKSLQLGGRIADGVLFQVGSDPSFVRYALDNIRRGAEAGGRRLEDLKLYMRLAYSVSHDRQKARDEVRGYAAVAATTIFDVPREYFDDDLYEELVRFKSQYDWAEHGNNEAKHTALLTDRIIDAVAVAGTPEDAVPRFRELAAMGLNGFVCPMAMSDPLPYMETLSNEVMVHL